MFRIVQAESLAPDVKRFVVEAPRVALTIADGDPAGGTITLIVQGVGKTNRKGYIAADARTLATSKRGVFAAGDILTEPATVILARAAGRKAARPIDDYLRGRAG
jgi:thioredoxin reductase